MKFPFKSCIALLVSSVGCIYAYHKYMKRRRTLVVINGSCDEQFNGVLEAFRQNFVDEWEEEGAALAIYHHGHLCVDLWGGWADRVAVRPWMRDTLTTVYSTSKALAALCIAKLVDQGLVSYSYRVIDYWPEFGTNNKDDITVRMLTSHQAAVAALDQPISMDDVQSPNKMRLLFEKQAPNWTPSPTAFGYHAITYGLVLDQFVRKVDGRQRSLAQYAREEITGDTDELYIGVPSAMIHRCARMSYAGWGDYLAHTMFKWSTWRFHQRTHPLYARVMGNPDWLLPGNDRNGFNNADVAMLAIPGANAAATARGLAWPFNRLVMGDILRQSTLDQLRQPLFYEDSVDVVTGLRGAHGHGFQYCRRPRHMDQSSWLLCHSGYGGQYIIVDIDNQLVIAYVTNSLKWGIDEHTRTVNRLFNAAYHCDLTAKC